MERTPEKVRKLNDILRADLGSNPLYKWRWSDTLLHVMDVVDTEGNPVYVESKSDGGLVVMQPKTMTRQLLPFHEHCWVLCALVETTKKDGELEGTGNASWVPVSGPAGPVALQPFEIPNLETNLYVIGCIRQARSRSIAEMGVEWDEDQAKKEKARWTYAYERIREESTAYYNVPGKKAHVSFPSTESIQ